MARDKKEGQNRLVQATIDDATYRALCERAISDDRPVAGVIRQALIFYLAHKDRLRRVDLS